MRSTETELARARRELRNLQATLRRVKTQQGTRSQAASVLRDQIAYAKAAVADELLALEWDGDTLMCSFNEEK
jgi:hypothetical protein